MHWSSRRFQLLGIAAALLAAGCDNTLIPAAQGGPVMSVYGYLDASADTQWIRVTPNRSKLLGSSDSLPIHVTLENLGNGRVVQLRDSIMAYRTMLGSELVYAHNFWTSERIEAGASYRFRATGAHGTVESLVRIPQDYRAEVWVSQPTSRDPSSARTRTIVVTGPKVLPFVFGYLSNDDACFASRACRDVIYPPRDNRSFDRTVWSVGPGVLRTRQPGDPAEYGAVEIVGSESQWPSFEVGSTRASAADSLVPSVRNGIGFVGGVITRRIWVEDCALPYPSPVGTFCKLSYDATAATLRGRADSAVVSITLRELDPPAGEPSRTRFAKLGAEDTFAIGAIRPGVHELAVQMSVCSLTDTLRFAAGQRVEYDVSAGSCR